MMIGSNHNALIGYLTYKEDEDDLLKWTLIGAGGAVLIIVAVVVAVCICRRKQRREEPADQKENPDHNPGIHKAGRVHGPQGKTTVVAGQNRTPSLPEGGESKTGHVHQNPTNNATGTGYLKPVDSHQGAGKPRHGGYFDIGYMTPTQKVGSTDPPRSGMYIVPT